MHVLVAGGAGYIGSHVARLLRESGHRVHIYDNLSTGHSWAVLGAPLTVGDLADTRRLDALLRKERFDAVMDFAAYTVVPESVAQPLKYYANNTRNTLNLLECLQRHDVDKLVFSSTAAVYGNPAQSLVNEEAACAPINPYGASKLMSERMISDAAHAGGARFVALRYFNVAGADPAGRIGQATADATHLIKVACQVALGQRPALQIFGTDYPTADGTCIRDFIHVEDLARAHVDALDYLATGGTSTILNCGYGHGHSVRDVVGAVRKASGRHFATVECERRPGDAPAVVADNARIRQTLGWTPRYDNLDAIVRDAWRWECHMADETWHHRRQAAPA